jgi:hypothetical protein
VRLKVQLLNKMSLLLTLLCYLHMLHALVQIAQEIISLKCTRMGNTVAPNDNLDG